MQRSRLKNIIAKSKEQLQDPFDYFKKSLPKEIDDNYRLEAAWKAYGRPKDYKAAIWEGMIQPIDENNYKFPSIGYNEEKDEYEYLNKGRENETVNRDIRVWDNDVIPFVKELKCGGYVRTFNEEGNYWTYSKNSQETQQSEQRKINSFKEGGKAKGLKEYKDFLKYLVDTDRTGGHYDYEGFWNDEQLRNEWINEEDKNPGKAHFPDTYKLPSHPTFSTDSKYSNSATEGGQWNKDGTGHWTYTTSPYVESRSSLQELQDYFRKNEPGVTLVYKGVPYGPLQPEQFKEGGQLNVIPEGALHARKNNMEGAGEDFTAKGIPVINNDGQQVAEIERQEIIFSKDTTEKIEFFYKSFTDESKSDKEKDELAIKCGKFLVEQILNNTDDKAGLIQEVEQKM